MVDEKKVAGSTARCRRLCFDLCKFERDDVEGRPIADEAEALANELLAAEPATVEDKADLLQLRGRARMHKNLLTEAEQDFREALRLSPTLSSAPDGNSMLVLSTYNDLSWIAGRRGVDAAALWTEAIERFRSHFPDDSYCNATAYINLALEYYSPRHRKTGGLTRAAECAEKALQFRSRLIYAHSVAAFIYDDAAEGNARGEERVKAISHYEACLEFSPADEDDETAQQLAREALERLREDRPPTSEQPSAKRSGCFIATAVYEDEAHPSLGILRTYRDEVLLASRPGQAFVAMYYRLSPFVARHLTAPLARDAVRTVIIDPLVLLARRRLRSRGTSH